MSQNQKFETWSTMTINGSLHEFGTERADVLNDSFGGGEREGSGKREREEAGEMWEWRVRAWLGEKGRGASWCVINLREEGGGWVGCGGRGQRGEVYFFRVKGMQGLESEK